MTHVPFQKLLIWQKAMNLAEQVHAITRSFPPEELYGLTSQFRRAAVSVASNIAEGRQRESVKDFVHFLRIASGSAAEMETQLLLARRLGYLTDELMQSFRLECSALRSMLHSFATKIQK